MNYGSRCECGNRKEKRAAACPRCAVLERQQRRRTTAGVAERQQIHGGKAFTRKLTEWLRDRGLEEPR